MSTDDIAVGAVVRYPRTGTTGKVVRIEEIDGRRYAELESTGLYYRVDELVSTERTAVNAERTERSLEDYLKEHKEIQKQLEEVWERGIDQSCEGGG
ncbi:MULTISPECIES: DUF2098 domain-containing protein [Methanoculleus]|jgi:hypothetical protein|uniref:DUF2098 domain-containing protein n=1 Tax=Methanoculleus thermophilus TaxID=2200 RepID=A0A1G8WRA2_9EURY|nr:MULTISPECIES: DUF2098 domain-containing protein [Methanoculleus]NLN08241.1 DUF2098 domain-containing protein [Methanoculleus thermophilus]SDJ80889.1 hypothetical protein SAMN04488571_10170 [Methanoculleus thermophilus]HQD25731.1 DUF2098 domain-containing protein [Methanoculleus thermophilus]